MKASILATVLSGLLGMRSSNFQGRRLAKAFDGGLRMPAIKNPSATYGKHTCKSSSKEIGQHNQLVNTRQVRRLRIRKPTHPSVANYA